MLHSETSLILTLWPPVQKDWDKISDIISSVFDISYQETYKYCGNDWTNFIIRLYKFCYEEYEHETHPNIPKMIPKAIFMNKFSNDIRVLEIKIKNPSFNSYKNGNPYGISEVKKLKDEIRLSWGHIPRFSVIHSFDTPVRNSNIICFLEDNCRKI